MSDTTEAAGLTDEQRDSFKRAENLARDLMAELYRLRSLFHPRSAVWHHVPGAQSTLETVKREIAKAKEVARAERAPQGQADERQGDVPPLPSSR